MPLPAPYAPPWKRLGEDLVATLAWLGLKLREMARRNGEGALPVPSVWPRRWTPLFWPLVLAAFLLAPAGLVMRMPHQPSVEKPSPSPTPLLEGEEPPTESTPLEWPTPPEPETSPGAPETLDWPAETGRDEPDQASEGSEEIGPSPTPMDGSGDPGLEADRLLAEWSEQDAEGLLVAIRTDPGNSTLTLQPSGTFWTLSPANRLGQAERWQARATDWGYGHLELVDGAGRLVGREARVGEGMILLEAAGAGGSPATDGEVGKGDGMFGNRSGGTGGALGSAPDARPRRWTDLLGRQRRG